jgi:Tol biopolymer transport system component
LLLTRNEAPNAPAPVLRYSITLPTPTPGSSVAVSPDGRFLAIAGRDASGNRRMWVRALDGSEFITLASGGDGDFPFWSPDSKELAYFAGQKLFRVNLSGGAPQQIADAPSVFSRTNQSGGAATWGKDGTILFSGPEGIYRVAASGGPIEKVSPASAAPGITVWSNFTFPQWLSGQRGLLYSTFGTTVAFNVGNLGALIHQPLNGTPTQLTAIRSRAQVTSHGVLIASVNGAASADLRLHQFDAATGKLDEPGIVMSADASLNFSASDSGVLVYRRGLAGTPVKFEWVDDAGRTTGDAFDSAGTGPFSLSKDESLLAFGEAGSIKVRDLRRGVTTTLVQGGVETVFSPDGSRIAYALLSPGRPRIVVQPASGGPVQVVYESDLTTLPEDWSSDGKYLVANEAGRRGLIVALDGKQPPIVYADVTAGPAAVDESRFSPDGKWLVYNAAEGGRHEVFLIPLPPTGERWQVSLAGGSQGRWRRDGSALYYLASDGALMKVDVKLAPGGRPELSRPRQLFATGLTPTTNIDQFAPNADGTRFLLRRPQRGDVIEQLEVIANWPALVKAGAK